MEVSAYEPVSLTENDWEKVRAFVRVVVEKAKADPNSPYSAKNLMGHVTAHVAWCHRIAGLPLEVSVVFDRDIIGEACERAFPSLTTGTLATRRSALLFVAQRVLPQGQRTARLKPLRDDKVAMPYDETEQLALRSWARGQTTPVRRRDCHTILALGLGAGLPAPDILRLRVRDIHVDPQGVLLRVSDSKFPEKSLSCGVGNSLWSISWRPVSPRTWRWAWRGPPPIRTTSTTPSPGPRQRRACAPTPSACATPGSCTTLPRGLRSARSQWRLDWRPSARSRNWRISFPSPPRLMFVGPCADPCERSE